MENRVVTIQLPETLYDELRSLADEEGAEPIDIIGRLVARAALNRAWLRDLQDLRERILKEGGLQIGSSRDDVVKRLRQTRREIFEAEYAHLY